MSAGQFVIELQLLTDDMVYVERYTVHKLWYTYDIESAGLFPDKDDAQAVVNMHEVWIDFNTKKYEIRPKNDNLLHTDI